VIPGAPEIRAMLFKAERATILDTWHVAGMRGTGSHDIEVKDIIVPPDDTFDIFLGRPTIPAPAYRSHCSTRRCISARSASE